MAVELNEHFSLKSFEDLKSIASQAWGHGIGEKSKGGKGYMGIMKGSDGTLSVFKCLTHSNEYKDFEQNQYPEFESELREASAYLKTALLRLGKEAGVASEILENILNDFTGGKDGYLNREMVAKAVTEIAKCAVKGGDSARFWKEITYTGKVHNTMLKKKTSEGGASIEFVSNADQRNITALKSVKGMATVNNSLPKTIDDLENRILSGDIGEEMDELLYSARMNIVNNCTSVHGCFSGDMDDNWLYDNHENDFFGHKTLADTEKLTETWDKVRLKMFKLSLEKALENLKEKLSEEKRTEITDEDINILFKRAYVRSGYAYAGLKTACGIAESRSIKCLFEDRLSEAEHQDAIIQKALDALEQKFDTIEEDTYDKAAAKLCLAGEFKDHETTNYQKSVILKEAANAVAFIFSDVKAMNDGNIPFTDDKGNDAAMLSDPCYSFNPHQNRDSRNGDEIALDTYSVS